jgi:hypothetical protein
MTLAGLAALARCRDTGDMYDLPALLTLIADLDVQVGRFQDAAAHLHEGVQIAVRAGDFLTRGDGLWNCASLCTATKRHADAATLWVAHDACARQLGLTYEGYRVQVPNFQRI